jgi:hypothetical protein
MNQFSLRFCTSATAPHAVSLYFRDLVVSLRPSLSDNRVGFELETISNWKDLFDKQPANGKPQQQGWRLGFDYPIE